MDDNNPQTVPIADQPVMPPAEMFAGMEGLVLPPVGGQQGWVPSAPPPVSSTSNTGPTPADGGQPPSVDYPNNGHDQGYQIPLEFDVSNLPDLNDPALSLPLDFDPALVAAVTDEAIAALLANTDSAPLEPADGQPRSPGSDDGEGLDPFSAFEAALSGIPSPPRPPPPPPPPPAPPKRRGRGPNKPKPAPVPRALERVGRSGRMTVKKSYNELDDNDDEFLMTESDEDTEPSHRGSSATPRDSVEPAAAPKARRGGRQKGVPTKPRAPKLKPKSVIISEIQINGVWVPHIPDAEGNLVPCDKRGEPLAPPPTAGSSFPLNAEASSSSSAAAPTGAGRTKRKRTNVAGTLSSPGPDDQLSQGSDFGSFDGSDEIDNGSKHVKKKVGAKSAAEKRAIAAREEKRLKKERAKDSERMAKDGTYDIDHFGVGERGRERAMLNEGYHDLRDTIPALRFLFDAHAPFDPLTDLPSPLSPHQIDHLPIPTSQNGLLTILTTATTYIPLLQRERSQVVWHAQTLEDFVRKIDGGEAAWRKWKKVFDALEQAYASHKQSSPPPEPTALAMAATTAGQASSSSLATSNPLNPPSPTTATFLKPPGARLPVPASPVLAMVPAVKDEDEDTPMPLIALPSALGPSGSGSGSGSVPPGAMTTEQWESLKERNRKKQRLFRERQKRAISTLEAQIKAVQGQVM